MQPPFIRPFSSKRPVVAALVLLIATCLVLSATAGCDTTGQTDPGDPDTLALSPAFSPCTTLPAKSRGTGLTSG